MTITATQYLFLATNITATAVATSIGGYVVPASTRTQIVAVTIANMATTNAVGYVDANIYSNTASASYGVSGRKTAIYPGGSFIVVGAEKHVMATGGAFQVTSYSTIQLDVIMTAVELT